MFAVTAEAGNLFDQLPDLMSEPEYVFALFGVLSALALRAAAGWIWKAVNSNKEMSEKAKHILLLLGADDLAGCSWSFLPNHSRAGVLRQVLNVVPSTTFVQIDLDFRSPWVHVGETVVDWMLTRQELRAIRKAAKRLAEKKKAASEASIEAGVLAKLKVGTALIKGFNAQG